MLKKLVIIIFVISAFLIGVGISFCFANTINSNCPEEVKQAIQNWDSGLDERDAKNQPLSDLATQRHSNITAQCLKPKSLSPYVPMSLCHYVPMSLRTLFLTSLITLTFNTPIHSQVLVSNFIQKLFTIAKHYFRLPAYPLTRLPALLAVFTALKRFFEKVIFLLLGLILPTTCLSFVTRYSLLVTRPLPIFYRFHNLRL